MTGSRARWLAWAWMAAALVPPALALDPAKPLAQYRLTQWGVDEGLEHGSVHMLTEDAQGFLWVGTLVGLSRFDGVNFEGVAVHDGSHLRLPPESGTTIGKRMDYFVRSIATSGEGMWAAIGEGGVAKRVDRRWVPFALPNSGIIRVIAPRASGGFWIGGERGVQAIDVTDGVPNLVASGVALKGPVWFIREDADRRLWVGSESGTHLREPDGRWRHLEAEFKLPPRITWTVFRDQQGVHWIGGRNGLIRFDDKGVRVYGPADGLALATVRAIAEDRTGALWIATPGGGLQRFRANGNGGRGEFDTLTTKEGLNSDSVMTVYADRAGNIWAGMAGGGVARLSDPPIASYRKKDGLTGDWIWTAHEDAAGDIWLGTNGNGVSVLRDVGGQVRVVRRIPGTVNGLDTVWSMHAWDPGRAIVSATQGIGRIERDDRVTWLYRLADGENPPRVFLRTRDGKLLVAKGRKLFEVRAEGVVDAGHPEFKAVVSSLLETPEGDLIAGTRQGSIQRLDRRANKLT
ncbi:MAG: hypothetical protein JNK75_02615, partial [Betaproteobacteria bacterium]|nr:hypothetical protein [Betaproteobacteria bacterium]